MKAVCDLKEAKSMRRIKFTDIGFQSGLDAALFYLFFDVYALRMAVGSQVVDGPMKTTAHLQVLPSSRRHGDRHDHWLCN
jgi:hypothetical protein